MVTATAAVAGRRRMSGFSLQFNLRVPLDGILNGDTKATLVAWGDDITFLDRDEDNGRRISRDNSSIALKRASNLSVSFRRSLQLPSSLYLSI